MAVTAAMKPFMIEIKDELFLPDGDVALLDYDD